MTYWSSLPFGLVLKSDRRQIPDRRRIRRGGRRATDGDGFEVSSAHAEDEELTQVIAAWGELLWLKSPSTDLRADG